MSATAREWPGAIPATEQKEAPPVGKPTARREEAGTALAVHKWGSRSAIPGKERDHVFHAEAAIAPLADAVERKFAAVAEALDGVDVKVEQLGHLTRREHRSEFVDCH